MLINDLWHTLRLEGMDFLLLPALNEVQNKGCLLMAYSGIRQVAFHDK